MTDSDYAAGQLRIIRILMERATIYRSISELTALVGGLLSMGVFAAVFYAEHYQHRSFTPWGFAVIWLVALALTALVNGAHLASKAQGRGEPIFSSGMKLAAKSLAPAFLTAGLLTFTIHQPMRLAVMWILLYGIGLLSTQHFAPRSLSVLGIAFFLTGNALIVGGRHLLVLFGQPESSTLAVSAIMTLTFGGFHLVYAAVVWALGGDEAKTSSLTNEEGHV